MDQRSNPVEGSLWKHGFLAFIIVLLVFNLCHLVHMIRIDYPYHKYVNLVVSLMLLFNHIAFSYTTQGRVSIIMKGIAFAWLAFGLIYIFWILVA